MILKTLKREGKVWFVVLAIVFGYFLGSFDTECWFNFSRFRTVPAIQGDK